MKYTIRNIDNFKLFSRSLIGYYPDFANINVELQNYVTDTAKIISILDGSSQQNESDSIPFSIPDYVIFLDKSARPVSWLVEIFWDTFAVKDKKIPKYFYIMFDRLFWFKESGLTVNNDESGNIKGPDGKWRQGTFSDFNIQKISKDRIKELRYLFVPGGVSEDILDNTSVKTILDNKNILIVDEVSSSGATLAIAKKIFQTAFPSSNIGICSFWHDNATTVIDSNGKVLKKGTTPVWYFHDKNNHSNFENTAGRGIGMSDREFFKKIYLNYPNKINYTRFIASEYLGVPIDLYKEQDQLSLRYAYEMLNILSCFKNNEILFVPPVLFYSRERISKCVREEGFYLQKSSRSLSNISHNTRNFLEYRKLIENIKHELADNKHKLDLDLSEAFNLVNKCNNKGFLPPS